MATERKRETGGIRMRIKMIEFNVGQHSEYLGTQFDKFFEKKDVVLLGTEYTANDKRFGGSHSQNLLVFYTEKKGEEHEI